MRTSNAAGYRYLAWIVIALVTSQLVAHATSALEYRWTNAGTMLQHGVPETDRRDARFDCDRVHGVTFTLPLWAALPPGGVPIAISQGDKSEMFVGHQDSSGDGIVVTAPIKINGLLLRSLAQGHSVRLVSGRLDRPLTGAGATEPVAQFIRTCRALGDKL